MRHRFLLSLLTTFVGLLLCARIASAQVVLKPKGENGMPLRPKSVKASVRINNVRFAVTDVELVFHNDISSRVEADFLYTVPAGAVVTDFAYYYGQERVPARIAEKQRAAQIYQAITSRQRDPALVEMVGKNTFRARIFPVEPNADLRVQMRWMQVLPTDAKNTALYTLPIKTAKDVKWDEIAVSVRATGLQGAKLSTNFGLPVSMSGDSASLAVSGKNYRTEKDLRVALASPPATLQARYLAAPSGGSDGFFAIALAGSNAAALDAGKMQITGVPVYSVETKRLGGRNTLLVCGRYRKSGTARLSVLDRATGTTLKTEPLLFGSGAEANNLPSKLWASARLEKLSASDSPANRREGIALSQRYTLPSRWTSWIAIPKEERQRYEQEIAWAQLQTASRNLYNYMQSGSGKSPEANRLRSEIARLYKTADPYNSANWQQNLQYQFAQFKEEAIQARVAKTVRIIGAYGGQSPQVRKSITALNRYLWSIGRSTKSAIQQSIDGDIWVMAYRDITEAIADGSDKSPKGIRQRRTFDNLCRWVGDDPKRILKDYLVQAMYYRANQWAEGRHGESLYFYWNSQAEPIQPHPGPKLSEKELKTLRQQMTRLAKAVGQDARDVLAYAESPWKWNAMLQKRKAVVDARRQDPNDTANIAQQEQAFLEEMRRPEQTKSAQMHRYYYENNTPAGREAFAKDRLERIAARIESERIDEQLKQPLSPEESDALKERQGQLKAREETLRARMGDPLVYVDAPKNAQSVVAILPNGDILPLTWDDATNRWQARFDIPTYATESEYQVTVYVVLADGARQTRTFCYTVDVTAPAATATVVRDTKTGIGTLEVIADSDTIRVIGQYATGETVTLVADPTRPGRFFGRTTKAIRRDEAVSFILTDRAHNRATVTALAKENP